VKRVAGIDGDHVVLVSDHPDHEILAVGRRDVLGRAILRYRPFNRTSVVRGRAVPRTPARGCC
jgi:hypothetical protein